MRDSLFWFLVASVVVSALFVVNARHQHRIAYLAFQEEEVRRDDLNDEWGRLLIAQELWSSPNVIERDARERLSMRAPKKGDVEFVDLSKAGREDKYVSR
ncbi:hypothetical protein NBRC116583_31670 [Arenicella sp. 4NH20-0111]|uniref:cell division protein FtsL n=1 Tax=Arenicella sp. 4NH20-0111 TaxID=3127648 RepID=UPI003109DAFF